MKNVNRPDLGKWWPSWQIIFVITKNKKTKRAGARVVVCTDERMWRTAWEELLSAPWGKHNSTGERYPLLTIWITNCLFVLRLFRGRRSNRWTHTPCPRGMTVYTEGYSVLIQRQALLGMGQNSHRNARAVSLNGASYHPKLSLRLSSHFPTRSHQHANFSI